MIDFTSLQSTVAEPLRELYLTKHFLQITFTGYSDDKTLISEINEKLNKLETSTEINHAQLESIIRLAEQIQLAHEEKVETLTRIDWLQRLYKAKAELGSVDTREKLKQLRNSIAPVQTCPLKSKLLVEIVSLEASMPDGAISKESTEFELLMENAINEVGDVFINLGKVGREYVIKEVLKQEGDRSFMAHVRACVVQLEQRVLTLTEISDRVEMIVELEQLPLRSFSDLEANRKERIADLLIEKKEWDGLVSLNGIILQFDNKITKEEREKYESENTIKLQDGTVIAISLDERYRDI